MPKSPYLALAQQWMKFEDFIYALADDPQQVEDVMKAIDGSTTSVRAAYIVGRAADPQLRRERRHGVFLP